MKITHVSTVHSSDDVRVFYKMCRSLARAGHTVSLVVQHSKQENIDGVRIVPLPRPSGRAGRFLLLGIKATRLARRENPDVYHFHDPELLVWALLLRATGKRVVFDMHENLPAAIATKPWIPRPLRAILSPLVNRFEQLAFRFIPVVFAEESYARHYPSVVHSVTVLNLPITNDIERLSRERDKAFRVVYVGAVAEKRGSLTGLAAMAVLRDRGQSVLVDIVGGSSGAHEEALRAFIAEHGLDNVVLHGRKPPTEAWTLAAGASLGLALLHPSPNYVESYPTKMFEYMALGMPVLVSDFPLYRTLIDATGAGRYVDPLDPVAIADSIQWFAEHPEEAREMGLRGKAAAHDKYNWSNERDKLVAFYDEL